MFAYGKFNHINLLKEDSHKQTRINLKKKTQHVLIVTDTQATTKKRLNFRQHWQRQMLWFCFKLKKKNPHRYLIKIKGGGEPK